MLEDRDYMRQSHGGFQWSATTTFLVINLVVFLLQGTFLSSPEIMYKLALSLPGLRHGYVWQLITFQFLHQGWLHLIFNSLALFFFGRAVENVIGKARFVQLYLGSGVIGGLVQILLALVLPRLFGGAVVGASAGVSGLIAAFAVMSWHERFTLLIYFFPVSMRGRTLFWGSIVLAVIGIMTPGSGVAHGSHLGGLLAGYGFIRLGIGMNDYSWPWKPFRGRSRKRQLVKAASVKTTQWPLSKSTLSVDMPEEEFISKEVDPILDKISAHGIQSLTDRERRILEAARSKMAKR